MRYELSLDPNYVSHWTVVDAVRELYQNALDQQTLEPENRMFCIYDDDYSTLRISNKTSVLSVKSLLMGATTKANTIGTVGKFGEGYKVAALVLARLGKSFTIYNYGAKEIWKAHISYSEAYKSDVLMFDVEQYFDWEPALNFNLTVIVHGITKKEYLQVLDSNLHLQSKFKAVESITTSFGNILLEDNQKGRVYVNGLFVQQYHPYHHGYDFKPEYLPLDRDRKLANSFDLEWLASKMWSDTSEHDDKILALASKDAADVRFVTSMTHHKPATVQRVATKAHETFQQEHGNRAVPVTTQEEANAVPQGYRPIIVPERQKELIKTSPAYHVPIAAPILTTKVKLQRWYDRYKDGLSLKAKREYNKLMKELQD